MATAVAKKRFDILGNIFSPLIVMSMELCWVWAWLVWSREYDLFPWTTNPINVLSLVFLMVVSFVVTRFIPGQTRSGRILKMGLIVLAVLGMLNLQYGGGFIPFSGDWLHLMNRLVIDSYSTLHPVIPALTAAFYVSWRGSIIGSITYSADVFRSFLLEFIAVVVLIILWTATIGKDPDHSLVSQAGIFIAGFFFFGLIALAMGHFLTIRQKLLRENAIPISNRRWVIIILTVIGGMVILGIGIASLFAPSFLDNSTSLFGKLIYYVNYAVEIIFIPLGYLIEGLWWVVSWLINLVKQDPQPIEPLDLTIGGLDEIGGPQVATTGFDPMVIVKWAAFVLVIALVIFLIYRANKRHQTQAGNNSIEEYSESVWNWLMFKADLKQFLSRLFDRWFGSKVRSIKQSLTTTRRKREEVYPDDMNIREIYRHVLHQASESGHRRHPYETPYEYAVRLDKSRPEIEEQVDGITDLYVNVRYGETGMKEWETEHANVLFRLFHRILHKPDDKS